MTVAHVGEKDRKSRVDDAPSGGGVTIKQSGNEGIAPIRRQFVVFPLIVVTSIFLPSMDDIVKIWFDLADFLGPLDPFLLYETEIWITHQYFKSQNYCAIYSPS